MVEKTELTEFEGLVELLRLIQKYTRSQRACSKHNMLSQQLIPAAAVDKPYPAAEATAAARTR